MKRIGNKKKKTVKGTPTAVLLSILIHAGLFLLAGMFVVFTVVKSKEVEFAPPKAVERPKMKLKKPKVKVKKSAKPKPTTRIVTKVQKASMPDIQLPEMSGIGEGLGGGLGGFDLMPDFNEVSVFGSGQSIGNDFEGTFYDLKRDRSGRNIPMDPDMQKELVRKFIAGGWKPSTLGRYYRSPRKLYATSFMIPSILSSLAPPLFGEAETAGYLWIVHYRGQLVHSEDITFRFFGVADQFMVIRVDGEEVFAASWNPTTAAILAPQWQSSSGDNFKYQMGSRSFSAAGDWITLKAGVALDMEVVLGEGNGGYFSAMLAVEVQGEEYELSPRGNPIFPMFKTSNPSLDQLDSIMQWLVPHAVNLTNGPVFCDYDSSVASVAANQPVPFVEAPVFAASIKKEMRSWSLDGENPFNAEFVTVIGKKVVLKDSRGKMKKIQMDQLPEEDRTYIELMNPPKFKIDCSKQSDQIIVDTDTPYWTGGNSGRQDFDYVFTAKLKQISASEYHHELKVEFFVIGKEIGGDNHILLDRQEGSFTPSLEDDRSYQLRGDLIRLTMFNVASQNRGKKYRGYLVVVSDEHGVIIDSKASHKWLLDLLVNLRTLPVGKYFDKTGVRVFPSRPIRWY